MTSSSIWSPAASEKFSFSPNCQDWALTTHDGRLSIWDCETGRIKQEFIPSAHLSSACTCLAWMPAAENDKKKKKNRKRKSSLTNGTNGVDHTVHRSDVIAVGTSSGSVLIYSLKTGDISAQFSAEKAHSDRINDIAWNKSCTEVFTASSDGFVGHFNVKKSLFIGKFRCEEGPKSDPVHSVCVHPSDRSILTGSVARVTWWDLDTKSPFKTFSGAHLGPVTLLSMVTIAEVCYLATGGSSEQDHTLSVWNLTLDKTAGKLDDSVVARFSANETVRSVSLTSSDEHSFTLTAVTRSGSLLCFDHNIPEKSGKSSKKKKPAKPRATVQIASEKDASGKVKSIPILDGRVVGDDDNLSLRVVHGNNVRPVFETLGYDGLETLTCLVRQPPTAKGQQKSTAGSSNLVVPKTSTAQVLAPGPSMAEKIPATPATPGGRKRKQSIGDQTESLAMVDRLRLLSREADSKTTPPRADSMLQLLLQGLNNKDRKILDSVLDRADEELIEKTVRKLPVEAVLPLITELQHYIKGRGMVNQSHSKWLRSVLQIHTAHLMSTPECPELLGPVYAMLEARTKHYGTLLLLKGKLDMMTRQIVAPADELNSALPSKEALLVYQDDSSDELSEVLDDLLLPASDTEDIWQQDGDDQDEEDESEEDEDDDEEEEQIEQIEISSESDNENGMANGNGTDVSMDSD